MTTLFLAGDVMTGRGLDQVLPHPADPALQEAWVRDAREYVALAESRNGPIARPVEPAYPWGIALRVLQEFAPDARIVNLETSITQSADPWPGKGIHYRMHPGNVNCLVAAGLNCCVLANNHVMDFGRRGLSETLETLERARLTAAGAGLDAAAARSPAVLPAGDHGRVLVYGMGDESSGIPAAWAAGPAESGVCLLPELSAGMAQEIGQEIAARRRGGDLVVVSVHWGGNWGYRVPAPQRAFAHALIDSGQVDCVHGHSSHHPKGLEVYRDRLIIYGCGDLVNDYEGISGHEEHRSDLALMYFARFAPGTCELAALEMVPVRRCRFALVEPPDADVGWLAATLDRESRRFGARVVRERPGRMSLGW
jgi:poly-gamma-glutamate synthesis protein (capsule biosynthesis protein)